MSVSPEWCDSRYPPCSCALAAGHHGPHRCVWSVGTTADGEVCDRVWNDTSSEPCVATGIAVLGMVGEPARVRCGLLDGHPLPHRFAIEWSEAPSKFTDEQETT